MIKTLAIQLLWNDDGLHGEFVIIIILVDAVSIKLLVLLMHVSDLALLRNATRPLSFVARFVRLVIVVVAALGRRVGDSAQGQRQDPMTTLGRGTLCAFFSSPAIIHGVADSGMRRGAAVGSTICEEAPQLLDDQGMFPVHFSCRERTSGFLHGIRIKDRKGQILHDMFATSRVRVLSKWVPAN
jgi:hypothetical protein